MSNPKHHITSIFTLYYPFSFCIPPMAVLVIVRNALQGMRHSVAPLICSALEMIGKIIFALWLVPVYGYIAVCICEPVTWVVCFIFIMISALKFRADFRDPVTE